MSRIRDMFPGGNTCYGFYSFYDYIVPGYPEKKIVLKGGPGVGKSTFMKNLAKDFSKKGFDIEYHWCSSDNNSLDAIVIGNQQICLVDGTAPHIVDPRYPGAVDFIINLGEFWDDHMVRANRDKIIMLTNEISSLFNRAYNRLKETKIAYEDWKLYYTKAADCKAVNRNVFELTGELLHSCTSSFKPPRHLFAAAITPGGIVNKVNSLIPKGYVIFAVKGFPGTGINKLFDHTLELAALKGIYVEAYHNPFDPQELDLLIFPESNSALVNLSTHIVDYAQQLPTTKYKRMLDFNQFTDKSLIDANAKHVYNAINRFEEGLKEAVSFIQTAKSTHDELETCYIPAMDFDKITTYRNDLFSALVEDM